VNQDVKYSKEELLAKVYARIAEKKAEINKLQDDLDELTQIIEIYTLLDKYDIYEYENENSNDGKVLERVVLNNRKNRKNDSEVILAIIKFSTENLTTKEIVSQYAERINLPFHEVRAFVDATLSRFKKEGKIDRIENNNGRGSFYKIKSPIGL
jgi:hypothetical protein